VGEKRFPIGLFCRFVPFSVFYFTIMSKSAGPTSRYTVAPPGVLKIVILGDGNVGKSSLMTRYVRNEFDSRCAHTVGVEFLRKEVSLATGERFSLQIWDTAGQERFRCLQRPFYRGTDVCMLVFSVDDKASMENLGTWMREFQRYAEVDVARFPFVFIGNKIDVGDDRRQVSEVEARRFCDQLQEQNLSAASATSTAAAIFQPIPYPYFETSAKDRLNVDEAFTTAVSYMKELKSCSSPFTNSGSVIKLETVNLRKAVKKGAKPCC